MIVHVLRESGLDPSWLVGSSVGAGLANSYWSSHHSSSNSPASADLAVSDPLVHGTTTPAQSQAGEWLVVEADESDRSMLSLNVEIAVLTNVELDHHATFSSLQDLREAFREFLAKAPQAVIWDRPDLRALRDGPAVFYDVGTPELCAGGSCFRWHDAEVRLKVPGEHNALNATAALEVARLLGVADSARTTIAGFTGAARRFQRLGRSARGAVVIDDYAHHPTEVAATLSAARTLAPRRLIAVFQPHLYSRTALLAEEFGAALALADVIVVLDVYPARERAEDYPGVSGETLVRATIEYVREREVLWRASFEEAQDLLEGLLQDGDLCVVMGAGDVDVLGRRLVESHGV
jgi:UDP-N-acetylmuramate--alanine ligase